MNEYSEREILRKANRLNRGQLVDWINEIEQDNMRLIGILKKYEEYSNADIKEEKMAIYNPINMKQEIFYKKIIKAIINDKEIKYVRINR